MGALFSRTAAAAAAAEPQQQHRQQQQQQKLALSGQREPRRPQPRRSPDDLAEVLSLVCRHSGPVAIDGRTLSAVMATCRAAAGAVRAKCSGENAARLRLHVRARNPAAARKAAAFLERNGGLVSALRVSGLEPRFCFALSKAHMRGPWPAALLAKDAREVSALLQLTGPVVACGPQLSSLEIDSSVGPQLAPQLLAQGLLRSVLVGGGLTRLSLRCLSFGEDPSLLVRRLGEGLTALRELRIQRGVHQLPTAAGGFASLERLDAPTAAVVAGLLPPSLRRLRAEALHPDGPAEGFGDSTRHLTNLSSLTLLSPLGEFGAAGAAELVVMLRSLPALRQLALRRVSFDDDDDEEAAVEALMPLLPVLRDLQLDFSCFDPVSRGGLLRAAALAANVTRLSLQLTADDLHNGVVNVFELLRRLPPQLVDLRVRVQAGWPAKIAASAGIGAITHLRQLQRLELALPRLSPALLRDVCAATGLRALLLEDFGDQRPHWWPTQRATFVGVHASLRQLTSLAMHLHADDLPSIAMTLTTFPLRRLRVLALAPQLRDEAEVGSDDAGDGGGSSDGDGGGGSWDSDTDTDYTDTDDDSDDDASSGCDTDDEARAAGGAPRRRTRRGALREELAMLRRDVRLGRRRERLPPVSMHVSCRGNIAGASLTYRLRKAERRHAAAERRRAYGGLVMTAAG